MRKDCYFPLAFLLLAVTWAGLSVPDCLLGHCDTMNGPVVLDAKKALEKGDATPVLKWIKPEYENTIRDLFHKTTIVRTKGAEAKNLAENYFFETLVRLHREGEGAPYSGLKSTPPEPIVVMSDQAIQTGSSDVLIKEIQTHLAKEIQKKFERVLETKKHVDESVEAGREYVEAYIQFTHYVEGIHQALLSKGGHEEESAPEKKDHQ